MNGTRIYSSAQPGFTFVETMLAVLVVGLLACAATLSMSRPLASAQQREAFNLLSTCDHAARDAARQSGLPVRLSIDSSTGRLDRYEGAGPGRLCASVRLPRNFYIAQTRISRQRAEAIPAIIEISAAGLCRSYALHVRGPGVDQWVVFAGLSGQMTKVADESTVVAMLETDRSSAAWNNAD